MEITQYLDTRPETNVVYAYPPYGIDLAFNSTNVTVEIGETILQI